MLIRRSIASIVLVCAISVASASAGPILSVTPSAQTVNVGDTFTVSIDIVDVNDLFSWGFDLTYDPTIRFLSADEGPFLQSGGANFVALEWAPGTLTLGNSLFAAPGVGVGGTLATATFEAMMAGTTSFQFSELLFADSSDPFGNPIAVDTLDPGEIEVNEVTSSVPEAPSMMVLMVAAVALAGCRFFTRA